MTMEKPVIGALLGNSAGVGPELVAKLAANGYLSEHCNPVIIGDVRMLQRALDVLGATLNYYVIEDMAQCDWSRGIPVLDMKNQDPALVEYGQVTAYCGESDLAQQDLAAKLCNEGKIEGFFFGPFHKGAMKLAGMHAESEHEYLANTWNVTTPYGEINMMDDLMTVRATSHVPLKDVSDMLTEKTLMDAVTLGHISGASLGIEPRMAMAAFNPHCGEFGLTGREEVDLLIPFIEKTTKETGWDLTGPYSADTLFIRAVQGDFDVVITLYHDQGQIALKTVGFERCITVLGGQPYPVATPAHGTAFDKVGTGTATTFSTERAVRTVVKMAMAKRKA